MKMLRRILFLFVFSATLGRSDSLKQKYCNFLLRVDARLKSVNDKLAKANAILSDPEISRTVVKNFTQLTIKPGKLENGEWAVPKVSAWKLGTAYTPSEKTLFGEESPLTMFAD